MKSLPTTKNLPTTRKAACPTRRPTSMRKWPGRPQRMQRVRRRTRRKGPLKRCCREAWMRNAVRSWLPGTLLLRWLRWMRPPENRTQTIPQRMRLKRPRWMRPRTLAGTTRRRRKATNSPPCRRMRSRRRTTNPKRFPVSAPLGTCLQRTLRSARSPRLSCTESGTRRPRAPVRRRTGCIPGTPARTPAAAPGTACLRTVRPWRALTICAEERGGDHAPRLTQRGSVLQPRPHARRPG